MAILSVLSFSGSAYCQARDVSNKTNDLMSKDSSQLNLYYETHGTGTPVIFLHGFGASVFSWRHLVGNLSRDYQLILIDLKGFGKSPKPNDKNYSIQDQAELVYKFIIEHDLNNLVLVGHSYGGGVALYTAIRLSEENSTRLSSLVLIDSLAYKQRLPRFIRLLRTPVLGPLGLHILPSKMNVKSILNLAYYDDKRITKDQIVAYAEPLESPGARKSLLRIAKQIVPSNIDEISARYKTLNYPTLILWGRQDKIVPLQVGERLHSDIRNSAFVVIEQCGHIPHEEKPDEAMSVISEFLRKAVILRKSAEH